MAFKKNSHQQINFSDSFHNLTDREKKFLEKSWAKAFGDEIFHKIDEEPFEVLYSDKPSRPNTPVNVIISSLLLKELLNLTDDELVDSLIFDIRFQYALSTTSFKEQPLSDRTLSRFRQRILNFEEQTGIDLMKNCILALSKELAKFMNLSTNIQRMDSMMIASNIRKLSRIELVYTCVQDLLKELQEQKINFPKAMNHYLEENDRNKTFYHSKKEDYNQIVEEILEDAIWLKNHIKGNPRKLQSFQNLLRMLEEQTVEEDHQVRFKTNEEKVPSSSLQSPKDPDATYRIKGKEEHIGYVANIVEAVDEDQGLSLITDYDYDQNIKSDSSLIQDKLNRDGEQEEKITLIADGSYGGIDNKELAKENNIDLITTKLQGRETDTIFAKFEFDEDKKTCLKCANNHKPIKSTTIKIQEKQESKWKNKLA